MENDAQVEGSTGTATCDGLSQMGGIRRACLRRRRFTAPVPRCQLKRGDLIQVKSIRSTCL